MSGPEGMITGKMLGVEALKLISEPMTDFAKKWGPTAAIPVVAGAVQYLFARKNIKEEMENLRESYRKTLSISPKMLANTDRAAAVFQELCAVAPIIALNPSMAAKVIEPRLNTGLTVDDVYKLTTINVNARQSIFDKSPMNEAKRSAGIVADRVFTTFGQQALNNWGSANKETRKRSIFYSDLVNKPGVTPEEVLKKSQEYRMKKESSQKVSESCAIEMMADRYVLLKQSSLYKEASVGEQVGKVLWQATPYLLSSLALAGIAHGVGSAVDAVKKKHLDSQADAAFEKVKKSSEAIQANQQLAHDAFDAIKTFAPSLAGKPMILKTFIEHSISVEGRMPPEMVNQLATAEGSIGRSKPLGFAGGFIETATGIGKHVKDMGPKKTDNG